MSLVRYNSPISRRIHDSLSRASLWDFYSLIDTQYNYMPKWDVEEGKSLLRLNLAGVKKENVSVKYRNGFVNVVVRSEKGDVRMSYTLPKDSDAKTLTAGLEDGILTLGVDLSYPSELELEVEVR